LKWPREGRIEGVLVVRRGKLGAPGDGAKRLWLRGEKKIWLEGGDCWL